MGVPQNGWFVMENPFKIWMIWWYLYGNEPPHVVDEPTVCNLHAMQTMEPQVDGGMNIHNYQL